MIIATIATQQFYVDFGTWIAQQTLFQPQWCAFLAYLMMWLVIDIVTEITMSLTLTWNRKERPVALDRVGGVVLAMIRWSII
ncbi:CvpA family protein, partial [Acinetobacter baumannii]